MISNLLNFLFVIQFACKFSQLRGVARQRRRRLARPLSRPAALRRLAAAVAGRPIPARTVAERPRPRRVGRAGRVESHASARAAAAEPAAGARRR